MKIFWWITIPSTLVVVVIAAIAMFVGENTDAVFTIGGIIAFAFFALFVLGLVCGVIGLIACIAYPEDTTVGEVATFLGLIIGCGLVVWFFVKVCFLG